MTTYQKLLDHVIKEKLRKTRCEETINSLAAYLDSELGNSLNKQNLLYFFLYRFPV